MPKKAATRSLKALTSATRKLIEDRIPDVFDDVISFATAQLTSVLKLPLRDAIREGIRLVIYLHTINPKIQKILIKQIWRREKLGKVRGAQHYVIELIVKNLKSRD